MKRISLILCLVIFTGWAQQGLFASDVFLWIEAESAFEKEIVPNEGLEAISPAEISAGDWVCSFSQKELATGRISHSFELPTSGNYTLWVRAIRGTGLSYQLDDAKEKTAISLREGWVDFMPIADSGSPHYPPNIGWINLGEFTLKAGAHQIAWWLGEAEQDNRFGGMDCFVLTTGEFTPRGKYKPEETAPSPTTDFPAENAWTFNPAQDAFSSEALLDLRSLNEKFAGEHGFIKLSTDGDSFVRGDDKPIRFWSAGLRTNTRPQTLADVKRMARFLAKRGVNAIRVFIMVPPTGKDSNIRDVNEAELENLYKLVAAMKAEGIYLIVDAYWAGHTDVKPNWDLDDTSKDLSCRLFFDPDTQAAYKGWMKEIYTRENPHTGIRLADDPAVAIIQLQNEDSMLWHQFHSIKGEPLKLIRTLYADFLKKKYGSLEATQTAWQNYASEYPADEWDQGLPGFLHLWDFSRDGQAKKGTWPGFSERVADQCEFSARTMRIFNTEIATFLRGELGCKQLINANNWRTSDLVTSQDAEYWALCANDVIARNVYTGGKHAGVNRGWQILDGQVYTDLCLIKNIDRLPSNVKQPRGHPFIIPEYLWTPPNLYQSEAPLMTAAQQSLTGLDVACWFSNWSGEWSASSQTKWTFTTPMQIGQWPAAALLFRKGYLKLGEPAVVEERTLTDLWQCKIPLIAEEPGWDPNQDSGNASTTSDTKTTVDPLAYLVGPVRVVYGGDPAKTHIADLDNYIDREQKIVRSNTGEIETDYGQGIYRVNAPKIQAVAGFLGDAGTEKLTDIEITCNNRYATITVLSMDDLPLNESKQVLVQIGTLARPKGWSTRPYEINGETGKFILSVGKTPWQIEKLDATLTITNPTLRKAIALDANGMPLDVEVKTTQSEGNFQLTLPQEALYVLLSN